jgi:hypothetical protein
MVTEPTVLTEGYGTTELHLGISLRLLKQHFGKPDRITKGQGARRYWIYLQKGFDCLISTKTQRILTIFFFRDGVHGHMGAKVATARGIGPSDSERKVQSIYENPYKQGGGFTLSDGDNVGTWSLHPEGVGFYFDEWKRVEMISIFVPPRRSRSKKDG